MPTVLLVVVLVFLVLLTVVVIRQGARLRDLQRRIGEPIVKVSDIRNVRAGFEDDERLAYERMQHLVWAVFLHLERRGQLPASLDVLTQPDPDTGEPYIESIPDDPWGRPYVYEILDDARFRVASRGPNGVLGDEDDVVWP